MKLTFIQKKLPKLEKDTGASFSSFLLGLLFIGLKLGQVINWSWWWVLAPFWIPYIVTIIFIITCVLLSKTAKGKPSSKNTTV